MILESPQAQRAAAQPLSREQLRKRIDTLEALDSVMNAIVELQGAEVKPGERVKVTIAEHTHDGAAFCTAHDIPLDIVIEGLRTMQRLLVQGLE